MKTKLILIALALVMVLCLVGCGSTDSATSVDDAATSTTDAATSTDDAGAGAAGDMSVAYQALEKIHNEPSGWAENANCGSCHKDGRSLANY